MMLAMVKRNCGILALAVVWLSGTPAEARSAAQAGPVFQESGGIAVIEIESAPVVPDWGSETAHAGFTGSSYYTWRGPDHGNDPGFGILTYRFNITNPGTYNYRMHNFHHHPTNSALPGYWYTRFDGGPWLKTISNIGPASETAIDTWNWLTNYDTTGHPPATQVLSAGLHTLEISAFFAGASLDRFHLYLGNVANPLDLSRPQSMTTVGPPPPPPPPPPPEPEGPHTGSRGDNNNLAHRCGCSTITAGSSASRVAALAGVSFALAVIAGLPFRRGKKGSS